MCINDYLSTYRKDYNRKKFTNLKKIVAANQSEYKDPINEGFRNFLSIEPTTDNELEFIDSYYPKAKEKYPGVDTFFENKEVDKETIKKYYIYQGRSIYQVDYCDPIKDAADKEYAKKNALRLPNDVKIPLTTYDAGYRDPKVIDSRVYQKHKISMKPICHLDPDDKIRKILNVTTGNSEYMGVIGKLGDVIIDKQLHGFVKKL